MSRGLSRQVASSPPSRPPPQSWDPTFPNLIRSGCIIALVEVGYRGREKEREKVCFYALTDAEKLLPIPPFLFPQRISPWAEEEERVLFASPPLGSSLVQIFVHTSMVAHLCSVSHLLNICVEVVGWVEGPCHQT